MLIVQTKLFRASTIRRILAVPRSASLQAVRRLPLLSPLEVRHLHLLFHPELHRAHPVDHQRVRVLIRSIVAHAKTVWVASAVQTRRA